MKGMFAALITILFTISACAQKKEIKKEDMETQIQKVSYAIGQDIGKNLKTQNIDVSVPEMAQGIRDAFADTSVFTEDEITKILTDFQREMMQKANEVDSEEAEKNKKEGEEFLAENSKKEGVVTLPSGLQYKVITKGNGPKPSETDKVTVNYRGTFINGEEFDSSYKRNAPITFSVLGVIPGWTEALKLMSVGDKWELYIPYQLAYGESGKKPVIGPAQTLLFEIELLDIVSE